jgi:AGCS family alanine or glycine:cation symporter
METLVVGLTSLIWSPVLIYLCLGAGLFFSFHTRFAQVRLFKEMLRLMLVPKISATGISSFQALAVSLSGRVGVGNIAGVAAAIGFGGPGAIFWMWVVAFLGASTAYIESTLAQIYKVEEQGEYRGGSAYYFEIGLGWKWLGIIFAVASVVSCGIFFPGVQANAVGNAVTQIFGNGEIIQTVLGSVGTYKLIGLGFILTLLGIIIFGGIKRIATFAEYVVPFMAFAYILLAIIVVIMNIEQLPGMFSLILNDAFTAQAGFGAAIGWGVKRGVYSNEAGQGTGTHAAAAAETEHPSQQGLVQAFSVYIDTLIVCSATAFMILITQQYNIQGTLANGQFIVQNLPANTEIGSAAFTQLALQTVFGQFGPIFVGLALFFFAFTTIVAYYYIAETNIAYLNRHFKRGVPTIVVKIVMMAMVTYGTINSAGYIWSLGDIGVGLMAWINIVGILIIFFKAKPTMLCLRDYETQLKSGKKIRFDPLKLGIKNAHFWEKRFNERKDEQ